MILYQTSTKRNAKAKKKEINDAMAMLTSNSNTLEELRLELEKLCFYDHGRRISKTGGGSAFAVPITADCNAYFTGLSESNEPFPHPFEECWLEDVELPPSKKALAATTSPHSVLVASVKKFVGVPEESKEASGFLQGIPKSWERHGDLIVLPDSAFGGRSYLDSLPPEKLVRFWSVVAEALKCKRLVIDGRVQDDNFRSPRSKIVLGSDGWVEHVDNGVRYVFDVTKCMFSSGNVSEKIRVANLSCEGQTIVDLYSGIGYFVLPYLVHGRARHVHACDWNTHALEALEKGLRANGVEGRCTIHHGDSRKFPLVGVADHVNLGLLPTSRECWPVACATLRNPPGGWLHIHGNVDTTVDRDSSQPLDRYAGVLKKACLQCRGVVDWIDSVIEEIQMLLEERNPVSSPGGVWAVRARHVEHVKYFSPRVSHIVLDLHCQPSHSPQPTTCPS